MAQVQTSQKPNSTTKIQQNGGRVPEDVTLWRIGVEQYHAMIASGAFDEDAPVELLEGWLVAKMPKNPAHALTTELVCAALRSILRSGWFVRSQDPITLNDSEPEPDVAIVKGHPRQYSIQHPGADSVAFVVEVADSSLGKDRGSKKRIYARAGIPVYWIVNLTDRWVEVYTNPISNTNEPDYRTHQTYAANEEIPVVLDGIELASLPVIELLPH